MKLFQTLLLAPATLGLLAPMAASAADLNLDGVNKYATEEQVTSVSQFSDVRPTDWAYQALSNLVERYGCVAGYPNGTYKGGQAMTRYEAAALLNACLDRVTEVTDELKRLMKEFEKELAVLKGRVDGLEAKVGELEANQFSTTTKLKGKATFVIGANNFGGDAKVRGSEARRDERRNAIPRSLRGDGTKTLGQVYDEAEGGTTFNYDVQLDFDTSFTGKDLLRTRLRAGNFANSAFSDGLNAMEIAFEEGCGTDTDCGDVVAINRLFYQFPVGSGFTATVGARVRQDDMLAMWPSVYPADTVLDIFTYGGAPGTYSLNLGGGAGLWWQSGGFSISANYVSANADDANPSTGGIANDAAAQTGTVQVGYASTTEFLGGGWGLAAAYTYSSGGAGLYGGNGTPLAVLGFGLAGSVNSVGISGYWQPSNGGWLPSISTGWGYNSYNADDDDFDGAASQSWYVGLQWADVFVKGNALGMAVGQPTFITSNGDGIDGDPNDGNYAWEWWYKFQVTDNISVTPALFYLSAPAGQIFKSDTPATRGGSFDNFGGLIKTTFKF